MNQNFDGIRTSILNTRENNLSSQIVPLSKQSVDNDSRSNVKKNRVQQAILLFLELLGMSCILYAILELARYIIVYHQEHPDFSLTWGLYIELSGLAIGLVYWTVVFCRMLNRLVDKK